MSIVWRQLKRLLNVYSNHRYLKVVVTASGKLSFKLIEWLPKVERRYR